MSYIPPRSSKSFLPPFLSLPPVTKPARSAPQGRRGEGSLLPLLPPLRSVPPPAPERCLLVAPERPAYALSQPAEVAAAGELSLDLGDQGGADADPAGLEALGGRDGGGTSRGAHGNERGLLGEAGLPLLAFEVAVKGGGGEGVELLEGDKGGESEKGEGEAEDEEAGGRRELEVGVVVPVTVRCELWK